jgi:hypothetical protein
MLVSSTNQEKNADDREILGTGTSFLIDNG